MIVSIGLVTFQSNSRDLGRTASSLIGALEVARVKHDVEARLVFVVNDTQAEHIRHIEEFVEELRPKMPDEAQISIIKGHGNVGYGRGQNKAILSGDSEYHLVINPDVSFDDNVISDCIEFMKTHPDTAMAVPQGYDHTDQYAYLSKRPPSILVLIVRALSLRWLNRVFRSQLSRYTYRETLPAISPVPVTLASGCFMFCRTGILHKVKGFNEKYFLYFEDFDLSMRLQKHGKIVELPDVRIRHYGGHANPKNSKRILHFARSAIRFFNCYGWSSHKNHPDPEESDEEAVGSQRKPTTYSKW